MPMANNSGPAPGDRMMPRMVTLPFSQVNPVPPDHILGVLQYPLMNAPGLPGESDVKRAQSVDCVALTEMNGKLSKRYGNRSDRDRCNRRPAAGSLWRRSLESCHAAVINGREPATRRAPGYFEAVRHHVDHWQGRS